MPETPAWYTHGSCKFLDPERQKWFHAFPKIDPDKVDAAKAICRGCPVQPDCRNYAFSNDERYGVWGGLDEDERRLSVRRARRSRNASAPKETISA